MLIAGALRISWKPVLRLLKSHFGYDQFLPLQEEIIDNVLSRRDSLVLMPTGGGKSLCYQLPALRFEGLTLVVSPLIALMKDQVDALKANGIAAEFINSTLYPAEISRVQAQARSGQLKILYLAPERIALSGFRNFLLTLRVNLIAIDEAHCISEWGHDFRPDYRNLKTLRRDFSQAPVIALTATATDRVREDIVAQLELQEARKFISSFNRANLSYSVQPKRAAFGALVALLRKHQDEAAIVYCASRNDTENLSADLSANGLEALPYHAGLDGVVRKETQEKFIRDEVPIVVATIAFGMGIDKPDIRLVVHYDLPKTLEGYYQETGRAGRDGLPSECVLFYTFADKRKQDYFIERMEDRTQQENAREKLAQVIQYGELYTCRRKVLLEYFGEEWEQENCGGCDVCLAPKEEFDATEVAQKVLSAVIRTGERFGMNHVVQVLRGRATERVKSQGHDKLTVFGIARDFDDAELKHIVSLLLAEGVLVKNGNEYPILAVTQSGRTLLRKRAKLTLTRPEKSISKGASLPDNTVPEYDRTLFEKLRVLRKGIADGRGVPPFVIFGDVALQQMASYLPQSPESFSRISGVGAAKLEQYSEEFLSVIRVHTRDNGLTERDLPSHRRERSSRAQSAGSTYTETKKLVVQKLPISEIAERRGVKVDTVINHLEELVRTGEKLELGYLMPSPERSAKIEAAFQQSGSLVLLAPVRDLLGGDYSYQEVRLERIRLRQERDGGRTA